MGGHELAGIHPGAEEGSGGEDMLSLRLAPVGACATLNPWKSVASEAGDVGGASEEAGGNGTEGAEGAEGEGGREAEADYVVFCTTDVTPKTQLAAKSGLELDRTLGGVVTNAALEAYPGLYVAGNLASYVSKRRESRDGEERRKEEIRRRGVRFCLTHTHAHTHTHTHTHALSHSLSSSLSLCPLTWQHHPFTTAPLLHHCPPGTMIPSSGGAASTAPTTQSTVVCSQVTTWPAGPPKGAKGAKGRAHTAGPSGQRRSRRPTRTSPCSGAASWTFLFPASGTFRRRWRR